MLTAVPEKIFDASLITLSFVTNQVFIAFTWWPYFWPRVVSSFHQACRSATEPIAQASSAYHICVTLRGSWSIRGIVAKAYIGMAKGSPWVVPSCDRITSPSMYRSEGALYVLYRTVESSGQVNWMLCNATFRELKALLASMRSTASICPPSKNIPLPCESQPRLQRSARCTIALNQWLLGFSLHNFEDGLQHDSPGSVANANGPHAQAFVKGNETAC